MAFRVVLSFRARSDIRARADYLRQFDDRASGRWLQSIVEALDTLGAMPRRFGWARENDAARPELRQMVVGRRGRTHRVIFEVIEATNEVRVYAVLASLQDDLPTGEIDSASFPGGS